MALTAAHALSFWSEQEVLATGAHRGNAAMEPWFSNPPREEDVPLPGVPRLAPHIATPAAVLTDPPAAATGWGYEPSPSHRRVRTALEVEELDGRGFIISLLPDHGAPRRAASRYRT